MVPRNRPRIPYDTFEAITYTIWPCPVRSSLTVGGLKNVETEGKSSSRDLRACELAELCLFSSCLCAACDFARFAWFGVTTAILFGRWQASFCVITAILLADSSRQLPRSVFDSPPETHPLGFRSVNMACFLSVRDISWLGWVSRGLFPTSI